MNFIRVRRPRKASQISECGGAGTGCGWCVSLLKRYFAEAEGEIITDGETLNSIDYAIQRAAYIKAGHGRPAAGAIPLPLDVPQPKDDGFSKNP